MSEEEETKKAKLDKKHFDVIYTKYSHMMYVYIYSYVKNKENAEDLTSITFEKALKGIDNYQWEGISMQSWLYRIARNVVNDFFRKKVNRVQNISLSQSISQDIHSTTVEDIIENGEEHIEIQIIQNEEEDTLYSMIMLFEEDDQYLLYYKYFENLSNREIAQIMHMSETNVGTKLQRIRAKIKKYHASTEK